MGKEVSSSGKEVNSLGKEVGDVNILSLLLPLLSADHGGKVRQFHVVLAGFGDAHLMVMMNFIRRKLNKLCNS